MANQRYNNLKQSGKILKREEPEGDIIPFLKKMPNLQTFVWLCGKSCHRATPTSVNVIKSDCIVWSWLSSSFLVNQVYVFFVVMSRIQLSRC